MSGLLDYYWSGKKSRDCWVSSYSIGSKLSFVVLDEVIKLAHSLLLRFLLLFSFVGIFRVMLSLQMRLSIYLSFFSFNLLSFL